MITHDDVVDLLKLCAVYDQRTVGPEDLNGWLLVARHARWTKRAAQRVIVEHYASGAGKPRITPAQVSDSLRILRRQAAGSFEDPIVPEGFSGGEYVRWYRDQMRAHVDELLERWADGQPMPTSAPAVEQGAPRRVLEAVKSFSEATRIPEEDA